jgi:ketopantoate reductase
MEFLRSSLIGSAFPACSLNGLTAIHYHNNPDMISTAPVGRMTAELLSEIIQSSGKESIHADRRFCSAT